MSADAKAWVDESDGWWRACHDGPCSRPAAHAEGDRDLSVVLADVESCLGVKLRWSIRRYQHDEDGLVGYVAP